jgi:hypothetical protein
MDRLNDSVMESKSSAHSAIRTTSIDHSYPAHHDDSGRMAAEHISTFSRPNNSGFGIDLIFVPLYTAHDVLALAMGGCDMHGRHFPTRQRGTNARSGDRR